MRRIEFTEDFADKIKGDIWEADGMLTNSLVNRGLAKYVDSKASKPVVKESTKKVEVKTEAKTENKPKKRGRKPKSK